jgi:rhodanese-related sulfurtransferase
MTAARFITALELERLMPMIEKGDCLLVDVRSTGEFRSGHIRCAKLMPVDEVGRRVGELERDKTLVIYCRSGRRCHQVLPVLTVGGREVLILDGGLERWTGKLVCD